jgi:hypothetical protein
MVDISKVREEVIKLINETNKWHSKREYRELNKNEFVEEMIRQFEYLYTNSKTLFEMTMQGDLNLQQLDYMLNMISKVNNGADYHSTSVQVGQKLVDTYVKPMLDKKNNE